MLVSPQSKPKIHRTSENIQQYYTPKCLIRRNCFDSEFCKSEQKESSRDARRANQVPSTE